MKTNAPKSALKKAFETVEPSADFADNIMRAIEKKEAQVVQQNIQPIRFRLLEVAVPFAVFAFAIYFLLLSGNSTVPETLENALSIIQKINVSISPIYALSFMGILGMLAVERLWLSLRSKEVN